MTFNLYITLMFTIKYAYSQQNEENWTLFEVTAFNDRERSLLYNIYIKEDDIMFLNGVTNEAAIPMQIVAGESSVKMFERKLDTYDIEYTYIPRHHIKSDREIDKEGHSKTISTGFLDWQSIGNWISNKMKKHANLEKRIITVTYEKREMFLLKVSTGRKKSSVFVLGGEEGRDWISPAIIMNFANNLLENDKLKKLLEHYEFYFVPVFNPDGYAYSMSNDRYWVKNRKKFFPDKICSRNHIACGVNIERNWYLRTDSSYSSESECNSVYLGRRSLSEEEPKALHYVLNNLATNLMAFITLKGFGRLITVPYGYTNRPSHNHALMMEILSSVSENLHKNHNTTYYFGTTANYIYNFTGNSADWVKKKLNIPIVYTVNMKYKDSFLPHTSHISPLTNEFITIMKQTLSIANDIYGPLFNNASKRGIHFVSLIVCLVAFIFLFKIIIQQK